MKFLPAKIRKGSVLLGILAMGVALTPGAAAEDASDFEIRPYVGAHIGYMSVDYNEESPYKDVVAENFRVYGVNAGLSLHRYLSVELGVFRSLEEDRGFTAMPVSGSTITGKATTDLYGYHLDVLGRLPISVLMDSDLKLDLLGAIGYGKIEAEWKAGGSTPRLPVFGDGVKDDDTSVRYSLGVEYHISDRFSARATVRYIDIDFGDTVDSTQLVDIGLNYNF